LADSFLVLASRRWRFPNVSGIVPPSRRDQARSSGRRRSGWVCAQQVVAEL
jgi:hypothetical protein